RLAGLLSPAGPWAIRQRIDTGDPGRAGRIARQAVEGGCDALHLCFDHLAWHGEDPSTLDATGENRDLYAFDAGLGGCAIYSPADLATVLRDIDVGRTAIALTAGAAALPALAALLALADERGTPRAALRIEAGLDPLHELLRAEPRGRDLPTLLEECREALSMTLGEAGVVPLAVHG